MRKKVLREGTSNTPAGCHDDRPEPGSPRLTTALHGQRPRQWFRVLARLAGGETALVAIGDSLAEVLAAARAAELPEGTRSLHVEQWQGGLLRGFWARRRCERNQLPAVPGARKRRGRRPLTARR